MQHKDKPLSDQELEAILDMRQNPPASDLLAARIISRTEDMEQDRPIFAMNGFHAFMKKPAIRMALAACLVVMIGYSLATPTVDMTGWNDTPDAAVTAQIQQDEAVYDEFAMMYDMQVATVLMEDIN